MTFFEKCNETFGAVIVPEDFISLDETLYPIRKQVKQYNLDKPAKYGILFKPLNYARYLYMHYTHAYSGKPSEAPNEFYIQGTANYIKFFAQNYQCTIAWLEDTSQWTACTQVSK